MKAWQVSELGEPKDVMHLREVPDLEPGSGELLVRMRAAAVNFPDALLCRGEYQIKPPLPFTPGIELCGEIVEVGEGVDRSRIGQRVVGFPGIPRGAFAEHTIMANIAALPAPEALSDTEAAALFVGYQTGWFGLHHRAHLKAGETLLVHAAAGGVGSAAVQLGKAAGATVIGVVGGPEKAETARKLGADIVIDRRAEDFVSVVKEATGGRGADVIYDPVGGETYTRSTKCIAFEGRIVIIGFASGSIPTPGLNHVLVKNYSIVGLHWGMYAVQNPAAILAAHDELTALAASGVVRPLISEQLPLSEASLGVQRVADGATVGRVVVVNP